MEVLDRRAFLRDTAAAAAALAWPPRAARRQEPDLAPIFAEIERRHDEAVQRLQEWIRQPSIAAEQRGVEEGCALTMRLLREAGFDRVSRVPTDGQPGIFATLDAGAALHAIRGAGRRLPVNLVLVAEGEEEIGSPHFPQVVHRPEVVAALGRALGVFMPFAAQDLDGSVTIFLGAK